MTTSQHAKIDLSDMPPCPWCDYPEGSPCMAKRMGYAHLCLRPSSSTSFTGTAALTIIAVVLVMLIGILLARSADAPVATCATYQDHIQQGGMRHADMRACRWTE